MKASLSIRMVVIEADTPEGAAAAMETLGGLIGGIVGGALGGGDGADGTDGADGAEPMEDPEEVHELAPQGVKAFIDEELRWGPGLEVAADRLRDCFHAHRSRYGLSGMSYTKFLRELRRIVPGVSTTSLRGFSGRSRRIYNGVGIPGEQPERKGARRG